VKDWEDITNQMWDEQTGYKHEMVVTPDFFLCVGGKVLDFSNMQNCDQLKIVMFSEFSELKDNEEVILIASIKSFLFSFRYLSETFPLIVSLLLWNIRCYFGFYVIFKILQRAGAL
jgi:hypothetical protein